MPDNLFVNLNGRICPAAEAPSSDDDHFRLRYGVYETCLVRGEEPEYAALHWQRLRAGLQALSFVVPEEWTLPFLNREVALLLRQQVLTTPCRVRVQVFTEDTTPPFRPQYLIEGFSLPVSATQWLNEGIQVDVLPDFIKETSVIGNFKISHNRHFLPARAAVSSGFADDVLLVSEAGNIVESAIANIFVLKDGRFLTPPLSEGCLAGTIRTVILEGFEKYGIPFAERPLRISDLADADEIFLCNGIRKIRWVRAFREHRYACVETGKLYDLLFR